jgi:myosin heavy subunit
MDNIGFTTPESTKIWNLLSTILELGNIEFDDLSHQ